MRLTICPVFCCNSNNVKINPKFSILMSLHLGLCDLIKKMLLVTTLIFSLFKLNAQETDNIKFTTEAGFLVSSASEHLGFFLNAEPKVKITKNAFIGLRVAVVFNPQKIEIHNTLQFYHNHEFDNGGFSFVPIFDYYLNENIFLNKYFFRPYLGLGVGPYLLTRHLDVTSFNSGDDFVATIDRQLGLLFRGGVESNNLRIGLEYNFISKADIEEPNGQTIGTVDNSYLGLSFGYVIGGRKPRSN